MDSPTQHPSITSKTEGDRAAADRHKPTFTDLTVEGVTSNAVVALFAGRDALQAGDPAADVVDLIGRVQRMSPFTVSDVWPEGAPDHWCVCETGAGVETCTVHRDYDPTDAELEQAWNGPDAHAAHRAAWALHQELHDRGVA